MTGGISFDDAMDLADSMGLPDGAFWAMSHELAGLDYGDGFPAIGSQKPKVKPSSRRASKAEMMNRPKPTDKPFRCGTCGKDFGSKSARRRHRIDAHGNRDAGAGT